MRAAVRRDICRGMYRNGPLRLGAVCGESDSVPDSDIVEHSEINFQMRQISIGSSEC